MKVIPPLPNNQDLVCYFVTKHSWKGKYKRIFSIGSQGITTYNPNNLEVTNRWSYNDILEIKYLTSNVEFFTLFFVKDNNKKDGMKFSTEHRTKLIIDVLQHKARYGEKTTESLLKLDGLKHHWSDMRLPVTLEITHYSLDQLDPSSGKVIVSYLYNNIEAVHQVSDVPGGFVIFVKPFNRMHMFVSTRRDMILCKMSEHASQHCAVSLETSNRPITLNDFVENKFGKYGEDEHITSLSEFTVSKINPKRYAEPARRLLCLSESCLIERDVQTYNIVTVKPLNHIFAIIRHAEDSQMFTLEYKNMQTSTYSVSQRDALLATLLDGVRSSGNRDVHVKMRATDIGKRWGPFSDPVEEEVESLHLKFLYQAPKDRKYDDVIERFNCNIPYSGLNHSITQEGIFSENKDKLILSAIQSILTKEGEQADTSNVELEAQFHTLRRLVASKVGFATFTTMPSFRDGVGLKVVKALNRENEAITHAAVDMLCALMHPMHDESDLRQEQLNKSCLLSNHKFLDALLNMWIRHVNLGTGALVVAAMLDFLTFALCVPYSETTESKHFDALLVLVATRGRPLFQHFQHPSLSIVKGAGLIMRALIEEGDPDTASKMQQLALCEGALPRHLVTALFLRTEDRRSATHRQLSRHLIGLWVADNEAAMSLLDRMLPQGLLNFLESDEEVPLNAIEENIEMRDNLKLAQDHASKNQRNSHLVKIEKQFKMLEKNIEQTLQHWSVSLGIDQQIPNLKISQTGGGSTQDRMKDRPIVLRKRREHVKSKANWKLFYYKFNQNHSLPNLIWNYKTREELREALEKELRAFYSDRENVGSNTLISWNYNEFEVTYSSLQDEVSVDGYYLRILLEQNSEDCRIRSPLTFFNNLYHKFLLSQRVDMKCMCVNAMSIVYNKYSDAIGLFPDIRYILMMLCRTQDKLERDRLVIFLDKLLTYKENVKIFLDENGIQILVDLLTLAHLHVSRARHVVQSNVIEASATMTQAAIDQEKEWYYGTSEQSKGPFTFNQMKQLWSSGELTLKTKVWAHGMDGWKSLHQISQLKWTLVAKSGSGGSSGSGNGAGGGVFNESELASVILSILIKICRYYPTRHEDDSVIWPLPKVKRFLSHSSILPHLVQLLLTFDPILVEKVATLLCEIVEDNALARKLYLTGVFYFILMYTGSNVLPIAKFLELTHTKQAFINDELHSSDLIKRSILGSLLPEAMLYYLENHGADKFAQIFLGEFDTPEAIWNAEMRRLLIEKIAAHIADFTPRLKGNNKAVYQFCNIPVVRYPQLENELFCNIFYLRHLCDAYRFPDWPINQPIMLLKDVLEAWKAEVERKPPEMSVDEAYEALGLKKGVHHEEKIVRKSYYKIASTHHPDKNPGGRDIFVRANKAYDFLCSRSSWQNNEPNPNNIVLVLRTQSILFHRHSEELSAYKYAGYKQLIKTIQMETSDSQLFSKSDSLLLAACELSYHTVNCSALNAEELNREGGFQVLQSAFSRCVSVLTQSLKGNEMPVLICSYIVKCYCVAAQFTSCRQTFSTMSQLVLDMTRILYFQNLTKLCCDVIECLSSFAIDESLRTMIIDSTALWNLLMFMFKYDYTLEECGVERNQDENNQEMSNRLAKLCVKACSRLVGTPECPSPCGQLFSVLLTPYLAQELVNDHPEELLKMLTSNVETPYLVWNNTTRAELTEILEANCKQSTARVSISLNYSCHRHELIIGNVFIRVYNEQPSFLIQDPKGFVLDLLTYLKNVNESSQCDIKTVNNVNMALSALNNVIVNNTGLEMQCIGHFGTLFPLLLVDGIHTTSLQLIATVTRNHECIDDIAATGVFSYLLLCVYICKDLQLVVDTLYALTSSPSIVKDVLLRGGYLFLLDLLCNCSHHPIRVRVAELFARLCNDKLSGPRIKLSLDRYLPPAITDAMKDSPQTCIAIFDSEQENPELLWNENNRKQLSSNVKLMSQQLLKSMRKDPKAVVKLPPPPPVVDRKEIIVGGVYLRLFSINTGWNLRKPKEFLTALLDEAILVMTRDPVDTQHLDLVSKCLIGLLQAQPNLIDLVPSLGHIPKLCSQVKSPHFPVCKSTMSTLHILSLSEACVASMSQVDCIGSFKYVLTTHKDLLSLTCETLARIFASKKDKIVKQAIDADLISTLLRLLDGHDGLESLDNASTIKAHIVKALKAMVQSSLYGGFVSTTLDKSNVWGAYKAQNHDLFIGTSHTQPYLTGVPASAGYLTQGNISNMPNSPPPLPNDKSNNDLIS